MTFSETIDALIPIYEEGMKAKGYNRLVDLGISDGLCVSASNNRLKSFGESRQFLKYKPKECYSGHYWFPAPCTLRANKRKVGDIKEYAIRPRLELLKRIQQDLKKEKS